MTTMEQLDDDLCYRALKTRDRRFDGRFYTAVLTTGIFCRPICPAATPKRTNVKFYPTVEAAMTHGFRPCLRCRPEAAPKSPASLGVRATVARAVRLIEQGALETGSVLDLAARLGMGDRHLRRLFRQQTGVTIRQHARARRLLRARQLIAESSLPMTGIADAAGFASLRRFNDAMKQAYGHAPTVFRRGMLPIDKTGRNNMPCAARDDDLILRLNAHPPFDAQYLQGFFRARAVPGLEFAGDGVYARGFCSKGATGLVICRFMQDRPGVEVILRGPGRKASLEIGERVRNLFDLDTNISTINAQLADDILLRPMVSARPGLRMPGCWERFELAVRAVLGQRISLAAARTLAGRLVARYGAVLSRSLTEDLGVTHLFPTPDRLVGENLTSIGLTRRQAQTVADMAELFAGLAEGKADGQNMLDMVARIKGIGPWTLNYFALRGLSDPDAFPATDLGIAKALAIIGGPDTSKALEKHAQRWRPWRAYAAQYLWSVLGG